MKIKMELVRDNAIRPTRAYSDDAGFDCYVSQFCRYNTLTKKIINYEPKKENVYTLIQGKVIGCRLGFRTEIPKGYYAAVVPRSGLALKHGITIVNSPGTVDTGFGGEWIAIVATLKNVPCKISIGDKICQFIIRPLPNVELVDSKIINNSERGSKGYGSSGLTMSFGKTVIGKSETKDDKNIKDVIDIPNPDCKICNGSGNIKQFDFDPEGPSFGDCECKSIKNKIKIETKSKKGGKN